VCLARHGLAARAGQFGHGQHAIAILVHRIERIAEPVLVLEQRDAPVAVAVHAHQVLAGCLDLGEGQARDCQHAGRKANEKTRPLPAGSGIGCRHRDAHPRRAWAQARTDCSE
jgi:hypothetical protein